MGNSLFAPERKSNGFKREIDREMKREADYRQSTRPDDLLQSTVKSNPFASSARKVKDKVPVPFSNDRVASDGRKDCLITDSNPLIPWKDGRKIEILIGD